MKLSFMDYRLDCVPFFIHDNRFIHVIMYNRILKYKKLNPL
jgi:hypothetical protein